MRWLKTVLRKIFRRKIAIERKVVLDFLWKFEHFSSETYRTVFSLSPKNMTPWRSHGYKLGALLKIHMHILIILNLSKDNSKLSSLDLLKSFPGLFNRWEHIMSTHLSTETYLELFYNHLTVAFVVSDNVGLGTEEVKKVLRLTDVEDWCGGDCCATKFIICYLYFIHYFVCFDA